MRYIIDISIFCLGLLTMYGAMSLDSRAEEQMSITQFQQFLNTQGYPVAVDGKLTVNGDGETETAWNDYCENGKITDKVLIEIAKER